MAGRNKTPQTWASNTRIKCLSSNESASRWFTYIKQHQKDCLLWVIITSKAHFSHFVKLTAPGRTFTHSRAEKPVPGAELQHPTTSHHTMKHHIQLFLLLLLWLCMQTRSCWDDHISPFRRSDTVGRGCVDSSSSILCLFPSPCNEEASM